MMVALPMTMENSPEKFSLRKIKNQTQIFDIIRKKWVTLQPEEWVRQNVVHALTTTYRVPASFIGIEKGFVINQRLKRFDIVVYNRDIEPAMLIECKAFSVPISQKVFDQLSRYNVHIKAPYLLATNGIESFCCQQNHDSKDLFFIDQWPELW